MFRESMIQSTSTLVHSTLARWIWVASFVFGIISYVTWTYFQRKSLTKPQRQRKRRRTSDAVIASAVRTLVVFGSGGHTAEMLALLRSLPPERYNICAAVLAKTDMTSEPRVRASKILGHDSAYYRIPRSREVGQSYVFAVVQTMRAIFHCMNVLRATRPDLILVNGPGTCLPVCLAALILRACNIDGKGSFFSPWRTRTPRIIFVESICRVTSLSLTGRLLYWLADAVLVQWPQLAKRYPRAQYIGLQL